MNEEKDQPDAPTVQANDPVPEKKESGEEAQTVTDPVQNFETDIPETQPTQVNHLQNVDQVVNAKNYTQNNTTHNYSQEEKISFHELELTKAYELNADYLPSVNLFIYNLPATSAIINTPIDEMGMAICQHLRILHNEKPLRTVVVEEHWQITLDNLLEKYEQAYKDQPDTGSYLIVQDKRFDKSRIEKMIFPLLKPGLRDILFNRIKRLKLTFLYLCHADQLVTESLAHPCPLVFNAYPVLLLVQQKYAGAHTKAQEVVQQVWQMAQLTGRIKVTDDPDVLSYVRDLSREELEQILEEEKAGYNVKAEREKLALQLREPLKNVLLFVAAFFEKVPLDEFADLVKLFCRTYEAHDPANTKESPHYLYWLENSDLVMESCGLSIQTMPGYGTTPRYKSYGFAATGQQELLLHLFESIYLQHVTARFYLAGEYVFAHAGQLSEPFLAGLIKTGLVCSQVNASGGLTSLALKISDALHNAKETRLRKFLEQYFLEVSLKMPAQAADDGRAVYYHDQLLAIPDRRRHMGWLLGQVTQELYPGQLHLLKRLLNGSTKSEKELCMRTIKEVLWSNLLQTWHVLQEVQCWHKPGSTAPDKSYSYVVYYLLLLLADEPGWEATTETLDYQIIHQLLTQPGPETLEKWLQQLMIHSREAIFQLCKDDYKEITDERLRTRRMQSNLMDLLASVLAGLYFVTEKMPVEKKSAFNIAPVAQAVSKLFQVNLNQVRSALVKHKNTYNRYLIQTTERKKRDMLIAKKRSLEKFIQNLDTY